MAKNLLLPNPAPNSKLKYFGNQNRGSAFREKVYQAQLPFDGLDTKMIW
jgi:hypothetical protein